jgi:hypothetical protein
MKTLQVETRNGAISTCCEVKESPMLHHKLGLQYTATGYGARIPTTQMIHYCGKWRRVYCAIFSNAGTCYIGKRSDNLIVS